MLASWTNWGFGLVIAALLAREIAKRLRIDFGWLVAAAYTGFVISTEGLSGSIALSQATPGSALNLVEKATGHGLPLRATVFTAFNLVPIVVPAGSAADHLPLHRTDAGQFRLCGS